MQESEIKINLEAKLVAQVTGKFFVASYQRGYRWGEIEVKRLLEDILSNGDKPYCLQPIVVRREGDRFELIDGQQRLTTLFLLYTYMHKSSNGWISAPKFSLTYETRASSQDYLTDMDFTREIDEIDYWFMKNAYNTIEDWFSERDQVQAATNMNKYLTENVKIIWYEVAETEDAIGLFTRLNIGKIPLTNAELVKAMFLSRGTSGMTREKQEEIALQWDNIERELQNHSLWSFLTNQDARASQTHIELILNLIAGGDSSSRDSYYTFFCFDHMKRDKKLEDIWNEIQHTFLMLKSWYEDHDLYHKIGYLITTGSRLEDLFTLSKGKTKRQFHACLHEQIKKSISAGRNYGELSYDNTSDQQKIYRLLLLFNVESVRKQGDMQRFPFFRFKSKTWSLEHIHAQHSEGMRTQEGWKLWLKYHMEAIRSLDGDHITLLEDMKEAIAKTKLSEDEFKQLHQRAVVVLSPKGSEEYLHTIANLALLSVEDNAALNNATFDVKRNIIVKMDQEGKYIPFCTRMVFLKYYTPSEETQIHFWGESDRVAYIAKMNKVLHDYLDEDIAIGRGGK
ncbi:MAG: DUF262 domain-containing protein [Oscillospiraceae bacterium]|nr:DUF262 domain-containing protein [Oscillospiraceae bacterium]